MTEDERQKRKATIRALAERWPKCFAVSEKQRRPLKIGIGDEVRALLTDAEVSAALAFYTGSTSYLKALVAGAVRIGLDGEPAGVVTADQEGDAQRRLAAKQRPKREPQQETKPHQSDAARRPILSLPSLRSTQRREKP